MNEKLFLKLHAHIVHTVLKSMQLRADPRFPKGRCGSSTPHWRGGCFPPPQESLETFKVLEAGEKCPLPLLARSHDPSPSSLHIAAFSIVLGKGAAPELLVPLPRGLHGGWAQLKLRTGQWQWGCAWSSASPCLVSVDQAGRGILLFRPAVAIVLVSCWDHPLYSPGGASRRGSGTSPSPKTVRKAETASRGGVWMGRTSEH